MQYEVKHNGVTSILPVFTRGVKRNIDEVNRKISDETISLDARTEALYEFLGETVGEEALTKMLGGSDLDDIDLNDMNILFLKITKAYDKPVTDFNKPAIDADTKRILHEIAGAARSVETFKQAGVKAVNKQC